MYQVHFATRNQGKVASFSANLRKFNIDVVHIPLYIPELRYDDVKDIAGAKVLWAYSYIGKPTIANDAGFYIPALNGFPMASVNMVLKTIGLEGILCLASALSDRSCYFESALAYMDEHLKEPVIFTRMVHGSLSSEILGNDSPRQWSELWKVFIPKNSSKTLSQMTEKEFTDFEASIEHESYYRKLAEWLRENRCHLRKI